METNDHLISTESLPFDMPKLFKKMPEEEVWISLQGEKNKFNKMLSLEEFMHRVEQNKRPFIRYTNEKQEKERFQAIMNDIEKREEMIKLDFLIKF